MKLRLLAALLVAAPLAHAQHEQTEETMRWLTGDDGLKAHLTPKGTMTEFYNTTLKHYFRTSDPAEVAAIQQGAAGPGWQMTGDNFQSYTAEYRPPPALPVCRFYARGPNSHFYTISATECETVKRDPGWTYEGIAFYAAPPTTDGTCQSLTGVSGDFQPVYRVYNDRFAFNDSNHRFTTNPTTYQQMQQQGWKGEGVVMCAPLATTVAQLNTEKLLGGTWSIPYRFGTTNYVDNLTFTDLYQSPSDGQIYVQGVNKFNRLALGQWSASINGWLALASYTSSGGYPYDAYRVTAINGNTMTGCYYFLTSASSSSAGCSTPFTATR